VLLRGRSEGGLVPSEIRDRFAVLDWIVSRHVHAYLDTVGRPVGEGRSSVFQDVPTEMRTCPYPGSRYHHEKPMNASAIQRMPPWPQLLALMTWLSHRHRQRYGVGVTNSDDLARITSAGILLVDYLALRRENPIQSGEVPLLVSGIYKVCLGYQLAYLPQRFAEEGARVALPDADGFLKYLEGDGVLIGEAEVCSCPPDMIVASYKSITQATYTVVAPQVHGLSIDWDRFDDFAEAAGDVWQEIIMFAIRTASWIPHLHETTLPAAATQRLNALLREKGEQLLASREGLVVEVAESVRRAIGTPPTVPTNTGVAVAVEPGTVAETIVKWLRLEAPDEMETHGLAVEHALQAQLPYEPYEAGVLERINGSLERVMKSLDLAAGSALTPASLSRICGRTMRDWASQ
jgi:hypothetical protein